VPRRTKTQARKARRTKSKRTAAAPVSRAATSDHNGPTGLIDLQRLAGNGAVSALLVARQPTEEATSTHKTLRYGAKGQDVRELQSRLNHDDSVKLALDVDGTFGGQTVKAVKQFQAAHPPLGVDGIVGTNTWDALDAGKDEPQDDEQLARKLFDRAAQAYGRGDYAHAYDFFTRTWELAPRTQVLFDRAQSLRRLGGRREQTIALYEQYIAEGGERSAEAESFVKELRGPRATRTSTRRMRGSSSTRPRHSTTRGSMRRPTTSSRRPTRPST
jgi:peptidoglycan hydrolase-like protein with peptidoglycan-binding domain